MSDQQEALSVVLQWMIRNEDQTSNMEIAVLSNVCDSWRQVVHNVLLQQATEDSNKTPQSLLLLPSMLRRVIRGDDEELESDEIAGCETFCAAWFRPEGIREKSLALDLSKDAELREIQEYVQQKLLLVSSAGANTSVPQPATSRFGPGGEQAFDGSDDDDKVARSRRTRRQQGKKANNRSRSPVRHRLAGSSNQSVQRPDKSDRVTALREWQGCQLPMEVLGRFSYERTFVENLLNAALQKKVTQERAETSQSEQKPEAPLLFPSNGPKCHETTFAVRGGVFARPDGYCLCMDDDIGDESQKPTAADVSRIIRSQTSDDDDDDDDDDEEIAEIKLQEYRDYLVRKEQGRRQLQREVLPRVIWSNPPVEQQSRRCVQFLNASGDHAVCVMTPPFACGPLIEPVTIVCVAIATEDGCFLSGLHHRFELGHLYPDNEIAEMTERSAICIATETWDKKKQKEGEENCNDLQSKSKDGAEAPLRLSVSEDGSNSYLNSDSSDEEDSGSWSQEKCKCVFQENGSKLDEVDADRTRRIHRGRFGPGSWHCYAAIFDGDRSEIRVDGVPEPITTDGGGDSRSKGMLDGLTLGSDHCFGVSLCCGQELPPEGDGAIAEVAVFQGRLGVADLGCVEDGIMREHGIPPGSIGETAPSGEVVPSWRKDELERKAEALFLWPPPPSSLQPRRAAQSATEEDENSADFAKGTVESVPLRYLTRHRLVSWKQCHPVTGEEVRIPKIGARHSISSSDW